MNRIFTGFLLVAFATQCAVAQDKIGRKQERAEKKEEKVERKQEKKLDRAGKKQTRKDERPKAPRKTPTFANVKYGDHPRQVFDFWQAKSDTPTPVVLMIHGGGWMNGDKSSYGTETELKPYLDAGISVAAINYRFIPQAMEQKVEPPVKGPLYDAARAMQLIRSHAKDWNIDKTRFGATGGSAGACTSLWLAYHDDLADPNSKDPIARESTRLTCAAVNVAQTSLDPKELQEWFPNANYAGHAFGFWKKEGKRPDEFAAALAERERIMPWIKEYSPIELLSKDDPPVLCVYGNNVPPAAGELVKDPTHNALYGVKLAERAKPLGLECLVSYKDAPGGPYPGISKYLIGKLKTKN